tara:strand:- start:190 stop:1065 length:876 start_codon:yes stop_codon:yes gene_type:complete
MSKVKAILLAGGSGTRMYPNSIVTSKQLLPVYDKPMIYYPLSTLLLAEIKDILIVTTPNDLSNFKQLLGTGSNLGIKIEYVTQAKPNGIAESILLAENFLGKSNFFLILGDNIFFGQNLKSKLLKTKKIKTGSCIFSYKVKDPQNFGNIGFKKNGKIKSIIEKPKKIMSDDIVTGLYFYDNKAISYTKKLKPSKRKELEITDLNNIYLKKNSLKVQQLGRGYAWIDAGTPNKLLDASNFIKIIEKNQSEKIGCIEEISFKNGWISRKNIYTIIKNYPNNNYTNYLKKIINL